MSRGVVVVLALSLGLGAQMPRAHADNVQRAKELFRRAEAYYATGAYEPALELYLRAYQQEPLAGFQFNIGQCYRMLGRHERAILHFRRYLEQSKRKRYAVLARQLIADSERQLAVERRNARDHQQVSPSAARRPRAPAVKHIPVSRPMRAEPGASAPSRRRLGPVYFWTGVGVTAALALTTTITGILALNRESAYNDFSTPVSDLPGIKDAGESLRAAANVSLGMAIAAAASTTVLYFFTDFGAKELVASAAPMSDGGALVLRGTF